MNEQNKKPRVLNPNGVENRIGSSYPAPFDEPCAKRQKKALGDALGLTDFGVNLTLLPPGAWSAQRHWHSHEDEFILVLNGEVTLVSNDGEEVLKAGMVAGFPAGDENAHHLINKSAQPAVYIEVGSREEADACSYPDIDLHLPASRGPFTNKKGEPFNS